MQAVTNWNQDQIVSEKQFFVTLKRHLADLAAIVEY